MNTEQHCKKCGYKFEEHTRMSGSPKAPNEGDLAVCINCGQFGRFDAEGIVQPLSEEEFNELEPESRYTLHRIKSALESVNSKRRQHEQN